MRLLLDTAVLIFAVESPDRLSHRATAALVDPANSLELSSVSLVEIALKTTVGKLTFSVSALKNALSTLGIRILPFTADHALELFSLPPLHRDPFDRQIIAQALAEQITVVTPDRSFRLYRGLSILW